MEPPQRPSFEDWTYDFTCASFFFLLYTRRRQRFLWVCTSDGSEEVCTPYPASPCLPRVGLATAARPFRPQPLLSWYCLPSKRRQEPIVMFGQTSSSRSRAGGSSGGSLGAVCVFSGLYRSTWGHSLGNSQWDLKASAVWTVLALLCLV